MNCNDYVINHLGPVGIMTALWLQIWNGCSWFSVYLKRYFRIFFLYKISTLRNRNKLTQGGSLYTPNHLDRWYDFRYISRPPYLLNASGVPTSLRLSTLSCTRYNLIWNNQSCGWSHQSITFHLSYTRFWNFWVPVLSRRLCGYPGETQMPVFRFKQEFRFFLSGLNWKVFSSAVLYTKVLKILTFQVFHRHFRFFEQ